MLLGIYVGWSPPVEVFVDRKKSQPSEKSSRRFLSPQYNGRETELLGNDNDGGKKRGGEFWRSRR